MKPDPVRDAANDRAARLTTVYHALADLHLRHDQIIRRRVDPDGWQHGVGLAMRELQEFVERELAEARQDAWNAEGPHAQ